MPAFRHKKIFMYFAAFRKHIGVYPPIRDKELVAELARYIGPKGNLQFPLSEPMPYPLIARIARSLAPTARNNAKVGAERMAGRSRQTHMATQEPPDPSLDADFPRAGASPAHRVAGQVHSVRHRTHG